MRRLIAFLLALTASGLGVPARAESPPPLKTEVYGRLPNVDFMQISPGGERLAYVVVSGDHRQLMVKDLAGVVQFSAPLADNKVRGLDWAGDTYLIITVSAAQEVFGETDELWHAVVLNLQTRKSFAVFEASESIFHAEFGYAGAASADGHWYGYFRGLTLNKTRGFEATFNANGYTDLYRVDLETGASRMVGSGRDRSRRWAVDASGALTANSEYDDDTGQWILKAGPIGGRVLATVRSPLREVELVGLGRTPGTVLVDKPEPEEWSLADGAHKTLGLDGPIDGYLFDPTTLRLAGVRISGDRAHGVFFDPRLDARLTALGKALNTQVELVSWSADARRMVLLTQGDADAGTYWLVDGGSVKPFAYSYPEVPDANVGPVRVVVYKAADGLEIHGMLTLPPGREAKSLPLVVIPHGGPESHDSIGFDWMAQAFANRGYAVFQPNFRGSDGYGRAFRDAGFGQWGRKMQTDISDGVAALTQQGVIDPKRACIFGGSYGGYAALAGVTLQQGLYRCAVSYGGLSDLNYFMDTAAPPTQPDSATARYLRKFLGVKSNDDPILRALSPARLASKADAPVLLIHGADDTVVPIGQSKAMEQSLRAAGKPVELLTIKSEDHWLSRDASRRAVIAAAVAFVEKHNPAQ